MTDPSPSATLAPVTDAPTTSEAITTTSEKPECTGRASETRNATDTSYERWVCKDGKFVFDSTVALTTTLAPTTTLPPPPPHFEGRGDDVVDLGVGNTSLFVRASHTGRRNFIVTALDANLQRVDGVVNEIGTWSGTVTLASFGDPADIRFLQVQADGAWTFDLLTITDLQSVDDPAFGGIGSQVVLYQGDGGIFTVAHDGERNFIVHVTTASDSDGLINEIGAYNGRQPIPPGPAIIEVVADGNWTFNAG